MLFEQDGAPVHTANSTQRFLENIMAAQWSKEVWPPYSPDLNPFDYGIWGVLQTKVKATFHKITNALRRTIRRIQERVIDADGGYVN
jgi:transposase